MGNLKKGKVGLHEPLLIFLMGLEYPWSTEINTDTLDTLRTHDPIIIHTYGWSLI